MTPDPATPLLKTLRQRFEHHRSRHPGIAWDDVQARIERNPVAVAALQKMEETGGEPDVIGRDADSGQLLICDCSPESPGGRRSLCYDRAAREARKEHRPASSALEMAASIGIELLDEGQYRHLQSLEPFDQKTSSWILTPADVRGRGGALFGEQRYGRVFTFHNGAQSYYAARGFRGLLKL